MKKGNLIAAAICAVIGCSIIAIASGYPKAAAYGTGVPGPGLWPICVSVVLLACSAVMAAKAIYMKPEDNVSLGLLTDGSKRVYVTIGILAVYVAALKYIGFIICTALMMTVFITWFSKKKWYICLAISLCCTMAIYLVFKMLLNVPVDFGMFAL